MQCEGICRNGMRCNRMGADHCWQHQTVRKTIRSPTKLIPQYRLRSPLKVRSPVKQDNVVIYTIPTCPYCIKAKKLLDSRGMTYKEIIVTEANKQQLFKKTGVKTVPQIFINDKFIGGYTELTKL